MSAGALPATGSVSESVAATPESLWPYVSDPSIPARFSTELLEAAFVAGATPDVGAVIEGRNSNGAFSWTTTSTVVECAEPRVFRWATGDADAPTATWGFEVAPTADGSILTHTVVFHPGVAPLGPAIEAEPERAHEIVDARLVQVLANMELTVRGIASLAEGRATGS
jgi:hypothetical protein